MPKKNENVVTTTLNSQVKVFVKTPENKTVAKGVRTMKDVDNWQNAAVGKNQKIYKEKVTTQGYEETSKEAQDSSKRPLESPPTNVKLIAKQAETSGTPTDNNVSGI